ncbi:MAG: FtsQ-type POTRA domain-containing protein [Candidatus Berkelbacteria bacterium]|nr:FtsQ-type POTRA domain-containing protein [Candidatus Berkelbacteria bacterium]
MNQIGRVSHKTIRPEFRKPEIIRRTEKPQRPKLKINLLPLKTFFYLVIVSGILYFLFFSTTFKIKTIDIEGVKSVEISDYLNRTLLGKNILLLKTGDYLSALSKNFPILKEAQIIRGLPSTVKIVVEERNQIMVWCNSAKCYEVDSFGYVYREISKPSDKIVLNDQGQMPVEIGQQIVSPQFINFYLGALDELKNMSIQITETKIEETTFKIKFKTSDGYEIIMDSSTSLKNQISGLKQILETNRADIKDYVDLRVEGVGFIK